MSAHPLDQAVLSALKGRHAGKALIEDGARRYEPAYAVFAAVGDRSEASLASLGALTSFGDLALIERDPPMAAPGAALRSDHAGVQMVAERLNGGPPAVDAVTPLGDADAADMLALAQLTRPGPFFERTHQLGDFFGIRLDGRLVAMAGERLKPDGYTEVSGVCTHPAYRGRGYAGALTWLVASRILQRGEGPFLHTYAVNTGAIALYQALGFQLRCDVRMVRLTRA